MEEKWTNITTLLGALSPVAQIFPAVVTYRQIHSRLVILFPYLEELNGKEWQLLTREARFIEGVPSGLHRENAFVRRDPKVRRKIIIQRERTTESSEFEELKEKWKCVSHFDGSPFLRRCCWVWVCEWVLAKKWWLDAGERKRPRRVVRLSIWWSTLLSVRPGKHGDGCKPEWIMMPFAFHPSSPSVVVLLVFRK